MISESSFGEEPSLFLGNQFTLLPVAINQYSQTVHYVFPLFPFITNWRNLSMSISKKAQFFPVNVGDHKINSCGSRKEREWVKRLPRNGLLWRRLTAVPVSMAAAESAMAIFSLSQSDSHIFENITLDRGSPKQSSLSLDVGNQTWKFGAPVGFRAVVVVIFDNFIDKEFCGEITYCTILAINKVMNKIINFPPLQPWSPLGLRTFRSGRCMTAMPWGASSSFGEFQLSTKSRARYLEEIQIFTLYVKLCSIRFPFWFFTVVKSIPFNNGLNIYAIG